MASAGKKLCYLFMGAPGVGKGTFAKIISRDLGMEHIAIGDLIRDEIRNPSSKYGKEFQSFVSNGELIPDHLVNNLALDKLKSSNKTIILDGFPRNVDQAITLDKECAKLPDRLVVGINIELDYNVTVEKLLGRSHLHVLHLMTGRVICKTCRDEFNFANIMHDGYCMPAVLPNPEKCKLGKDKCNFVEEKRSDDNLETITKRFQEFKVKTAPLLDYYSKQKKLYTFNVKKGVADAPDLVNLMTSVQ